MSDKESFFHGVDSSTSNLLRIAWDVIAVLLGGFCAFYLRFKSFQMSQSYAFAMVVTVLLVVIILPKVGAYEFWLGRRRIGMIFRVALAYLLVGAALAIVAFVTGTGIVFSRIWVGLMLLGAGAFSIIFRLVEIQLLRQMAAAGELTRTVLLIGDLKSCLKAYQSLQGGSGVGFVVDRILLTGDEVLFEFPCAVGPYHADKVKMAREEEIWICLPLSSGNLISDIQRDLALSTANIRYLPDLSDLRLINHKISNIAHMYLLDLSCTPLSGANKWVKEIEDRLLAALILIIISPIMFVLAVFVKLSSSGPIFYRQERVSLNGRVFKMLKFRSMPVDVEASGVVWGTGSKKITKVGEFMRKTSLDELPQFINVLLGDMSIVGPRPERTVFVDKFKYEIPGYMQKHMVKAGITGWAQVNGWRGDTDLKKRIECDLWYIRNWSLLLDFKIIFLTVFKGF